MHRARFYINGRFLTQRLTGVQRFATEIVRELGRKAPERREEIVLVAPSGTEPPAWLQNIEFRPVGMARGHVWEQTELPLHTRDGLLLSLCNTGPLLKADHVVVIHDAAVMAFPGSYSWAFRIWYRVLLSGLGRTARCVLSVSRFSVGEIQRRFGIEREIAVVGESGDHVLRQAADRTIVERTGLADRLFLLAVSSDTPSKNFRVLVEAIKLLKQAPFEVVIAGGANSRVFTATSLTLPGFVKRIGYVSDPELRALYEGASCFVFPSLYEGFGLPPLEAMTCGCPVIAAQAASIPEVCGPAARYFDPTDPAALAAAIREVMADDALRRKLAAAGLERARSFRWEDAADQVWSAMQGAARSSGRREEARS